MKPILWILFVSLCCEAFGDIIRTKQGIVYKGKILEETTVNVTILVDGEKYPVTVLRSFIQEIEKEGEGSTSNDSTTKTGSPNGLIRHQENLNPKKSKKLGDRKAELLKLIAQYLSAKDEKRKTLIPLIKEFEGYQMAGIENDTVSLGTFSENKGWLNEPCTVQADGQTIKSEWSLILPPGYTSQKPSPLLIALHGGGPGVGDNDTAIALLQSHASSKKWILMAPTIPTSEYKGSKDMWHTGIAEEFVFILMQRIIERFNVDLNRIYVAGHSMGGFVTWHYVALNGGLFAAGGAASGGPMPAETFNYENFIHSPIYIIHGIDDTQVKPANDQRGASALDALKTKLPAFPYPDTFKPSKLTEEFFPHIYVEIKGYGHGCPDQEFKKMIDWMFPFKRNLYPKKIIIKPWNVTEQKFYAPRHQQNCWLQIVGKVEKYANVWASAEVHGNTILLETSECDRVAVYLHDTLIDMDQPLKIYLNGKEKFHSVVDRNLEFAVKHMLETQDRGRFFTSVVYLDIH